MFIIKLNNQKHVRITERLENTIFKIRRLYLASFAFNKLSTSRY